MENSKKQKFTGTEEVFYKGNYKCLIIGNY